MHDKALSWLDTVTKPINAFKILRVSMKIFICICWLCCWNLNLYKFLSQVSVPCITILSVLWCKLRAATFHFDKRMMIGSASFWVKWDSPNQDAKTKSRCILDFKLSPCSECCMLSSGLFPQHLNFICRCFRTLCLFHLHRQVVCVELTKL
jgi:hypothetical protein